MLTGRKGIVLNGSTNDERDSICDDNGLVTARTIDAFFEAENKPYLANHTKLLCAPPPLGADPAVQPSAGRCVSSSSIDTTYVDQKPCWTQYDASGDHRLVYTNVTHPFQLGTLAIQREVIITHHIQTHHTPCPTWWYTTKEKDATEASDKNRGYKKFRRT